MAILPSKKVQSLVNKKIQVEMKRGKYVLEGVLRSVDDYMNLHLEDTMEILDEERTRKLGSVLLRGNNIVFICPAKE
ncbi:MAG: Putative snRNP Sm-like protein [Candidatus Methanolliviera sp. GoM_oil]|nr:MAG: Putative snRNP Sm-like protein [Candidatus Methanolliviera sp. GoM_oil]